MATQKRILIWSVPRSLSTVLMRSLSQARDSLVLNEYLLLAGLNEVPEALGDRKDLVDIETESSFNIQSWKAMYEQPHPGKSFILGKEMADSLGGRMEMIPDGYTHVFLMRHPFKSITSHYKSLWCFPEDVRYSMVDHSYHKGLAGVYDYVTQTLGHTAPVVLDTADLLAKPAEAVRLICEATGMPFSQELLRWDQVKDELPSNWLMPKVLWSNGVKVGMYKSAFESTCFHTNEETSGAATEGTDTIKPEIQQLIQDALPYYDTLSKHRLVVE
ncbi:uncharacterized protein LOC119724073 [Patiria miniata]|uniref:Sulfotransferase family protein n=1 Tax=Patiria miniata TaxID=46514 RepID=A0A913ZIN6_PATMI|nr:uncharacterized protein LOC119724073 [Patiria miniata]